MNEAVAGFAPEVYWEKDNLSPLHHTPAAFLQHLSIKVHGKGKLIFHLLNAIKGLKAKLKRFKNHLLSGIPHVPF